MSDRTYKRKLIEVAIPLDAINAESAHEKSIRHGHPSTLHLWWARRPLVACRAVLFAQLVDDPSSRPEEFPTELEQDKERERLFRIMEELVKWENSVDEDVLRAARTEIQKSYSGTPPSILDPFAGGGSIPLEAQRLGLEARGSDLNPVSVLINRALVEVPARWSNRPPSHPEAEIRTRWQGIEGLAEDIRKYAEWMRDEAESRIGSLYPDVELADGSTAKVIAWIWARTIKCPNPGCGAEMPLVRSFWLGKKKGKEAWIRPVVAGTSIDYLIDHGSAGPDPTGTVSRSGATCLACRESVSLAHVRSEGQQGRISQSLMAVAAEGDRRRVYVAPSESQQRAADSARPEEVVGGDLPEQALGFRVQAYGMTSFADLFTSRQHVALSTLAELVAVARDKCKADAEEFDVDSAEQYADDVATFLGLFVSKLSELNSSLCRWKLDAECPVGVFGRQTLSMVWDYAEANPLGRSSGSWDTLVRNQVRTLTSPSFNFERHSLGRAEVSDARSAADVWGQPNVVCTDPPYYDNIGYANLSDFFYGWLRASTRSTKQAGIFGTMMSPKVGELIAEPGRHDGQRDQADSYFEDGFLEVFTGLVDCMSADDPMTLFYAFKQAEALEDDGLGSTGWSTMLESLGAAGLMVVATWPLRTESAGRMRNFESNALASSVVLACRRRPSSAGVTDRQGLIRALHEELPGPLHELQKAHIAPVDLRQAAIGPGMAVFSRFAKVIEPDGSPMRVRTALGLINQVLDQVLDEQEQEFDAETRWAIHWFSQFFLDEGAYGTAEQLAVSMNVAVTGMVESGIVEASGGKVRLLARDELPLDWDPETDLRTPVWEATQHLVRRLEADGEASAARLLRRLGGLGESAQLLAYRLYTVCERTRPNLAGPYNALVASWPEIQRLARETLDPTAEYEQQSLDG